MEEIFEKGMFVIIPKDLKYTDNTCGISETMYNMAGQRKIIDSVNETGIISIGGFVWDSRDFQAKVRSYRMEEETRTLFKGMTLTVPNSLKFTKLKYSINSTMKTMEGNKHIISEIYGNGNFRMCGFSWDKRDFQSKKTVKKIPIAHFDPEELVT